MNPSDQVLFRELPMIQKIIADETWLEGERRHQPVAPEDPVVQENVCQVILRIGAQLRASVMAEIMHEPSPITDFPADHFQQGAA